MVTSPVPDYFQEDSEEALRSRVQWLEAEISLGDPFFARLLRGRGNVHAMERASSSLGWVPVGRTVRDVGDDDAHPFLRELRLWPSSDIARTRSVGRLTATRGEPGAAVDGFVHQELPGDARPPRRG